MSSSDAFSSCLRSSKASNTRSETDGRPPVGRFLENAGQNSAPPLAPWRPTGTYPPTGGWDGFPERTRRAGGEDRVRQANVGGSVRYPWAILLLAAGKGKDPRIRRDAVRDNLSTEGRVNLVPTTYRSRPGAQALSPFVGRTPELAALQTRWA